MIRDFTGTSERHGHLAAEAEFNYLHKVIKTNKKEISQLGSKLEQTDSMITELTGLN